jgi:cytidine deaminase
MFCLVLAGVAAVQGAECSERAGLKDALKISINEASSGAIVLTMGDEEVRTCGLCKHVLDFFCDFLTHDEMFHLSIVGHEGHKHPL